MHFYSYTSLKMIHDQRIQESLDRQRLPVEQETRKQGLFQTFLKLPVLKQRGFQRFGSRFQLFILKEMSWL